MPAGQRRMAVDFAPNYRANLRNGTPDFGELAPAPEPRLTDAAVAPPAERRASWGRAAGVFGAAFALALVAAVTLRAGPKLSTPEASIAIPAAGFQVTRGRGRVEGAAIVLEGLDAERIGALFAATPPFAAADYTRATWRLAIAAPPGAELGMLWRTRERPGRTFLIPLETTRGSLEADLAGRPDWQGTIVGVGLAVRGSLDAPLPVLGFEIRSNAWTATLAQVLRDWGDSPYAQGRTSLAQMSFEEDHVAPFLAVVAAALATAIAWIAFRAWRRREAPSAATVAALFLVAWLALDLRWQTLLWREHAASIAAFAGKTLDEQRASSNDAPIFEVARRIRDADRPKPARILVLSDNNHLRARVGWFLYPENVFYENRPMLRPPPPAPEELRAGDQVVLLLYGPIAWDRDRKLLVWSDGRTRAAREILSDGPAFALVAVQ